MRLEVKPVVKPCPSPWMEMINKLEDTVARCTTLSKWQLFQSLCSNSMNPVFVGINGITCTVQSIQKESGCGHSFNCVVQHKGRNYNCYIITID